MSGKMKCTFYFLIAAGFLVFTACKKEVEPEKTGVNQIPYYDEVPTIIVENYINRMFVDLVGREPLDSEMVANVKFLRDRDLSVSSRDELARRLQFDTAFHEGEISYHYAYYHWFYERLKADVMEAATRGDIEEQIGFLERDIVVDSLNGDTAKNAVYRAEIQKLQNVLDAEANYRDGKIGFKDVLGYMVNNKVYDIINMNTFNFINAVFDNLFFRLPTAYEFQTSFDIIEYNKAGIIMGKSVQNKDDYVDVLINSREFYTGMIYYGYDKLLVREPTTAEAVSHMGTLFFDNDYQKFQRKLITSDEYAQFEPKYR